VTYPSTTILGYLERFNGFSRVPKTLRRADDVEYLELEEKIKIKIKKKLTP
jgi:hypothetical protein